MKLRSKGNKWYIKDGDKEIVFSEVYEPFVYMFYMLLFKSVPCVPPSSYPVRSLTPNPKPIELTLEDKIKISRIKAKSPLLII